MTDKSLWEIFDNFKDDPNTRIFQFIQSGQSWGAKKKGKKEICAKVSFAVPYDICNPENTNLGELRKYAGIIMFFKKDKLKEFLEE